jgi:protein SCO1/2
MNPAMYFASIVSLIFMLGSSAMAGLPGDSIYHLDSQWIDQNTQSVDLRDFAGKKVVLSMTYTSCQHTCPMIVSKMQFIEDALSVDQREQVAFVLVSLMPDTDTPAVMKEYEKKRGLDGWSLLSGSNDDVRTLAMAINVKYKPTGDGEVSHSNLIHILSAEGSLKYSFPGLSGGESSEMIEYLQAPMAD